MRVRLVGMDHHGWTWCLWCLWISGHQEVNWCWQDCSSEQYFWSLILHQYLLKNTAESCINSRSKWWSCNSQWVLYQQPDHNHEESWTAFPIISSTLGFEIRGWHILLLILSIFYWENSEWLGLIIMELSIDRPDADPLGGHGESEVSEGIRSSEMSPWALPEF